MIYLKCIQDCFMDSGVQCFTNGARYQIISGSPQDIGEVELRDNQGSSHFVNGEWAERFLVMAPSMEMDDFFESISGLEDRRKEREECKLWEDEPKNVWTIPTTAEVLRDVDTHNQIWERDSDYVPVPPRPTSNDTDW